MKTKETQEVRRMNNELCPICGAHLQNWREAFGEEHYCFPGKSDTGKDNVPSFSHIQQVIDDEKKVTLLHYEPEVF